jgi:hypothetical protein
LTVSHFDPVLLEVLPGFFGARLVETACPLRTSMFKPVLLRLSVVLRTSGSFADGPKIYDVTHH